MHAFAVHYAYSPTYADERRRLLPDHRLWLQAFDDADRLVGAGKYQDGSGALLILLAEDHEDFVSEVSQDPFAVAGLVDSVTVKDWSPNWGMFSEVAQ